MRNRRLTYSDAWLLLHIVDTTVKVGAIDVCHRAQGSVWAGWLEVQAIVLRGRILVVVHRDLIGCGEDWYMYCMSWIGSVNDCVRVGGVDGLLVVGGRLTRQRATSLGSVWVVVMVGAVLLTVTVLCTCASWRVGGRCSRRGRVYRPFVLLVFRRPTHRSGRSWCAMAMRGTTSVNSSLKDIFFRGRSDRDAS